MLVLLFENCKHGLRSTLILSITACLILVCLSVTGQESEVASQAAEVIENPNLGPSLLSAAANGSASISDEPAGGASAAYTASAFPKIPDFPEDPQPPQEMMIQSSPTTETFTNLQGSDSNAPADITYNGLRGAGGVSGTVEQGVDPDRSGAQGTFAATNQNWQNPPLGESPSSRGGFQQPSNFGASVQPTTQRSRPIEPSLTPPVVNRFGNPQNVIRNDQPPMSRVMVGQANSNQASGDVEAQASPWRREVPATNLNSQRYSSSPVVLQNEPAVRAAYNADAVSDLNRGVDPRNTAGAFPSRQFGQDASVRSLNQPAMQNLKRDDAVTPSSFNQPLAPAPRKKTDLAKQLISRYSIAGLDSSKLPGSPVTLLEMLNQPISTEQRRPMVHQFWDTYFDWASLVNSQQYEALLNGIPAPGTDSEKAILLTARQVAKNEVLASEIQLIKSQSKLKQFMPNRSSNLLPPLPGDLPLIQKYNTNYESYKQYQLLPANLIGIDKMLPKTLELITERANTVQQAQATNQQIGNKLASGQGSIVMALEAARLWRASEQSLLVAVTGYNHAIVDYALTVSRGYQPPTEVVRMLIGKPKTVTQPNDLMDRFRNARASQSIVQFQTQNSDRSASLSNFGGSAPAGQSSSQLIGNANGRPPQFNAPNSGNPSGFNLNAQGGFQSSPSAGASSVAPATPVGQGGSLGRQGQGAIGGGFNPSTGSGQANGDRPAFAPPLRKF
ncbi:MAG: hypothetical protein P8J27_12610 [Mariniblastus sp.]|nr:hypothetical protein [Mariniblastus sp.]